MTLKYLALTCYKLDDLVNSLRYAEASLEIRGDSQLQAYCSKLKREIKARDGYGNSKRVNFNVVFSKFEHDETRFVVIDILENAYREIGQQMDTYPSKLVLLAYWESYSVVSYLVDKYNLYRITGLLQDLGQGTDFNTAFSSAFSITYDRFVQTWGKE